MIKKTQEPKKENKMVKALANLIALVIILAALAVILPVVFRIGL